MNECSYHQDPRNESDTVLRCIHIDNRFVVETIGTIPNRHFVEYVDIEVEDGIEGDDFDETDTEGIEECWQKYVTKLRNWEPVKLPPYAGKTGDEFLVAFFDGIPAEVVRGLANRLREESEHAEGE